MESEELDLVIVGAGPAGLAAGVRARELDLNFLILERSKPLWTVIELYPENKKVLKHPPDFQMPDGLWLETCEKHEFLEKWEPIWKGLEDRIRIEEVQDIVRDKELKVVTNKGSYLARNVILAIGIQGMPRKLGIPGENLENVHYHLKHPEKYKDKVCLVVGGGDVAVETAISLDKYAKKVYISYRKEKFFRPKPENLESLEKSNVEPIFRSNLVEIKPSQVVIDINGEKKIMSVDDVFICIGSIPNRQFLEKIGLELDQAGRPVVNEKYETSVPGILAIGDLVTTPLITFAVESAWKAVESLTSSES